jgi:shikimate dehydrogenase
MKKACVIGWPITHSRSPLIHGYWLKKYGIAGSYTKEAVEPQNLKAFLENLAASGYAGCNVTVPHKEAALQLAAHRETVAEAIGAANTLWIENGRLHATNTDTYGYMTYLNTRAPEWKRSGNPVSILGAGGAARAIIHGFLEAGVEEIRLFNRTRDRAEQLARHFGPRVRVFDWAQRQEKSREVNVLVNTTAAGMKGEGALDLDFHAFNKNTIVSDIVYVPLETQYLKNAAEAELKTVDGLGMLLHQAVPGFQKWFGVRPEVTDELYQMIASDIRGQ